MLPARPGTTRLLHSCGLSLWLESADKVAENHGAVSSPCERNSRRESKNSMVLVTAHESSFLPHCRGYPRAASDLPKCTSGPPKKNQFLYNSRSTLRWCNSESPDKTEIWLRKWLSITLLSTHRSFMFALSHNQENIE